MSPAFSGSDSLDQGLINPVSAGKVSLIFRGLSDLSNLGFIQLCQPMKFSFGFPVSALAFLVGHVFLMTSNPQVTGIAAISDVASVENVQIYWDVSERDNPSRPVRSDVFPPPDNPISAIPECTSPEPAVVRTSLGNLAPKALFEGKLSISHDDLLGVNVVRDRSGNLGLLRPVNSNRMDA